ncbi:MAG: hypothetical protein F6K09_28770 [Merismopedia sp. SIO2A8]|nr:hypothetical protein [Merismopedia sp. SIO2A8]
MYIALAYYHENQAQIETELAALDAEYDRLKQQNQLTAIVSDEATGL